MSIFEIHLCFKFYTAMKRLITKIFIILLIGISTKGNSQVTLEDSFMVNGLMRNYFLYVPAINSAQEPVPLVLNLHGYGSNKLEQLFYGDFRAIADTANFMIAVPNGSIDLNSTLSWNTFGIGTVDDVDFISQLIDRINTSYSVDQNRIYSTGMSNGGFMSFELACQLSNRITAIASVTGSMLSSKFALCNPTHPIPVMQIHGTMDGTIPYEGNFAFSSIDSLVSFWRTQNQCNPSAEFEAVPNIVISDNCTAEHYTWNSNTSISSVEFYKVIGGGHSWPGAIVNINTTNMDFSASKEIWRFFSQYRKNELVSSVSDISLNGKELLLFPNPSTGEIYIKLDDKEKYNYFIINHLGQKIHEGTNSFENFKCTLKEKGIYTIVLRNTNQTIHQRFIIN